MRNFDAAAFDRALADLVSGNRWQEEPQYYSRYRSRYEAMIRRFAKRAPNRPVDVLDIGGGQLAFLAVALWDDRGSVADIDDTGFTGLRARGIDTFEWNLALEDAPFDRHFDAIFISEVIAHLSIPGHIALRRLRMLLRPGGLRNLVYLLRGQPLFDHFDVPEARSYGPVVEYSAEHLAWQFARAGFVDYTVDLEHFPHVPNAPRIGCCPPSAPRCAGSPATGTTSSPSAPRRDKPTLRMEAMLSRPFGANSNDAPPDRRAPSRPFARSAD